MTRWLAVLGLVALIGLAADAPAGAKPRWSAGFESRSLLGGWNLKRSEPGGIVRVRKPVRQGRYAVRFKVRPGDEPGGTGERAELSATPDATAGVEGTEQWYGWSTFFPTRFNPTLGGYNIFVQWHKLGASRGCTPGPNIAFRTSANTSPMQLEVEVAGGSLDGCDPPRVRIPLGQLRRNRWIDFAVGIRWSPIEDQGRIEVWIDGKQVVAPTPVTNLFVGHGVYVKQGIYRKRSERTTTLYQDGMRRGATRADVTLPPLRRSR